MIDPLQRQFERLLIDEIIPKIDSNIHDQINKDINFYEDYMEKMILIDALMDNLVNDYVWMLVRTIN